MPNTLMQESPIFSVYAVKGPKPLNEDEENVDDDDSVDDGRHRIYRLQQ